MASRIIRGNAKLAVADRAALLEVAPPEACAAEVGELVADDAFDADDTEDGAAVVGAEEDGAAVVGAAVDGAVVVGAMVLTPVRDPTGVGDAVFWPQPANTAEARSPKLSTLENDRVTD